MNWFVVDWSYVAGFFDGEGNIQLRTRGKYGRSTGVCISIGQKKIEILNTLKAFLIKEGLEKVHVYPMYNAHNYPKLQISNKWDCQKFLEKILDRTFRREDVLKALEFIKTLKKHTRPFTADELTQIIALYQSGYSTVQIGRKFGCSDLKVEKFLREKGVLLKRRSKEWREKISRTKRKNFSDEEFLVLYKQGYKDSTIARKLEVRVKSVCERRENLGLKANKGLR